MVTAWVALDWCSEAMTSHFNRTCVKMVSQLQLSLLHPYQHMCEVHAWNTLVSHLRSSLRLSWESLELRTTCQQQQNTQTDTTELEPWERKRTTNISHRWSETWHTSWMIWSKMDAVSSLLAAASNCDITQKIFVHTWIFIPSCRLSWQPMFTVSDWVDYIRLTCFDRYWTIIYVFNFKFHTFFEKSKPFRNLKFWLRIRV